MKLEDLTPKMIAAMLPADRQALGIDKAQAKYPTPVDTTPTTNAPNKTEREALHVLRLHLMDFEGRTFDNPGGGKYTVDWYGNGFAVEVKGEHIFDRGSRPKFDAAKAAHPELTWIWARKRTKGRLGPRWEIQVFPSKAVTT